MGEKRKRQEFETEQEHISSYIQLLSEIQKLQREREKTPPKVDIKISTNKNR